MEPQVIDYYNEMPMGINVIEKMNEEFIELQKNYDKLNKVVNKYRIPCFKVDTVEEYNEWTKKLEKFTEKIHEIIKDEESGLTGLPTSGMIGGRYLSNLYDLAQLYKFNIDGRYYYDYGSPNFPHEEKSIEQKLIEELNKLTGYKNEEWSVHRIKFCLKEILTKYPISEEYEIDWVSDRVDECICSIREELEFSDEPILYCNFIPENCEENEVFPDRSTCLYNMVYYNCEKCNKISNYGEPENVDNKLLCGDCFWDYCD
jgi:hypothetical protein